MTVRNQVCSLEQAKRLKQLGVNQDSLWYFNCNNTATNKSDTPFKGTKIVDEDYNIEIVLKGGLFSKYLNASAFTVAELGVMLPSGFDTMFVSAEKGWRGYDDNSQDYPFFNCLYVTEAEARAAMLIHLLENKIITPEEINQRLK